MGSVLTRTIVAWVAVLALSTAPWLLLGSCDGSSESPVGGASPGGGGTGGSGGVAGSGGHAAAGGEGGASGGGGGGLPEWCVDIHADHRVLPDVANWWPYASELPRHPFWRSDLGLHASWVQNPADQSRAYLVVATFEPEAGVPLHSRLYQPYPASVSYGSALMEDVAGAQDGSFAALIGYPDSNDPYGYVERVVLGNVAEQAPLTVWIPPWPASEAALIHVGWDGEAFAVHALSQSSSWMRLVRLAPDGTVVTPAVEFGTVTSVWEGYFAAETDPQSGTSWLVSSASGGLWLSGHLRDGQPLPGTEAQGGALVAGQGLEPGGSGHYPAIGLDSEEALLAWRDHGSSTTRLQGIDGASAVGDGLAIADEYATWPSADGAVLRSGDQWWMGLLTKAVGIESLYVEGSELVDRTDLVPHQMCGSSCLPGQDDFMDARSLSAKRHGDELWFGFWDLTDFATDEHPDRIWPYRVVRVAEGCVYPTVADLVHAR